MIRIVASVLLLSCLIFANAFASYDTTASGDKLDGTFTSSFAEPYTIVVWVKRTAAQWAATGGETFISLNEDTVDQNDATNITNSSEADKVAAVTWGAAGNNEAGHAFTDGTYDSLWIPIVAVFNSNADRKIYIGDSTNTASDTTTRTHNNVIEIAVGGRTFDTFSGLNGLIAEVSIYNIAFTTGQVDEVQTASETGPGVCQISTADCIGGWSLSVDQATHADESVAADVTLTVQSSAPYSSDHPTITTSSSPLLLLRD